MKRYISRLLSGLNLFFCCRSSSKVGGKTSLNGNLNAIQWE
jgi:hypothetical protein